MRKILLLALLAAALSALAHHVDVGKAQITERREVPAATPEKIAADVDAFWAREFRNQFPTAARPYRSPRVVLHRRSRMSPLNGNVGFYDDDDAEMHVSTEGGLNFTTFVLSHEFAHHVQSRAGLAARYHSAQARAASMREMRMLTIAYELQAECISGVWARSALRRGVISDADIAELLARERRYGDSPTHGRLRDRLAWFDRGFKSGRASACAIDL